jgi:hypothetical protein
VARLAGPEEEHEITTTIQLGCDSFSGPTMTPCSGGVVMGGVVCVSHRVESSITSCPAGAGPYRSSSFTFVLW